MLGEKYGLEIDRHLQRRRHDQRQGGALRRHGSLRRAQTDREATSTRPACWRRPRTTPTTWAIPSARAWPSSRSSRCSGSSRWRSWPNRRRRPSWRTRSASFPKNTRTPTVTGWRTSRTGASRASCGGASAFRPGTCPKAATWWPQRPRRRWRRPARRRGDASLQLADLRQDEDVLDTWFSSWLWPISVFDGIRNPDNKEIDYYYPTNDLVTGPDIIFFWVARMIMAGYEYRGEKPFGQRLFHGHRARQDRPQDVQAARQLARSARPDRPVRRRRHARGDAAFARRPATT